MLALTEPIGALTKELKKKDKGMVLVVHPVLGANVKGPTVLRVTGLHRTLKDQYKTTKKYQLLEDKAERRRANKQEPVKKSLQHQGKLATCAKVDTSRMTRVQLKAYERNKMVTLRSLHKHTLSLSSYKKKKNAILSSIENTQQRTPPPPYFYVWCLYFPI
jgi:hypothetical protein